MMRFQFPWALLLLLLLPALLRRLQRPLSPTNTGGTALLFSSRTSLSGIPRTLRLRLRKPLLLLLRIIAFVLIVLALARPQTGFTFQQSEASGKDILLALDLSGSMQAMDFFLDGRRVNRLQALQSMVDRFIDDRKGDRIGLVVFGDQSYTLSPLTLDYQTVQQFVKDLEIGMAGQGTAIGDALGISLTRMKEVPAKSKVIVLVTDGKNNSGTLAPKEVAELAKKLDVKVHVIGIGSNEPAPFPVEGLFGTHLAERPMDYDEDTLKSIAETSGGVYFNARDTEQLREVYQEIDSLEERKDEAFQSILYEEHYAPLLVLALVALLLLEILSATWLLEIP